MVFPSRGCKNDIVQEFGVAPDLVEVIGNPVDCARVRRRSSAPLGPDAALFDGRFVFANIARLDVVKGHDLLFAACRELLTRRDDFVVLCVGDGPARSALEAKIEGGALAHTIKLLGERTNPFPILAKADAAVLSSRFEAFALVLVEALALARPVVSVDCPFGPREVLEDGRYGLLSSPDAPVELAAAMERLITEPNLRAELSRQGLIRARQYDAWRIARTWESLIDDLPPAQPPWGLTLGAEAPEEIAMPMSTLETELHLKVADIPTEVLAEELASRLEGMPGNPLHDVFYRRGFHLLRKHFYLPIPDDTDRLDPFWGKPSALPGLNMNDEVPLRMMKDIFPPFLEEFRERFPIYKDEGADPGFYLINGGYMAVDAHVYYSLIRQHRPKRILEIGVGNSTLPRDRRQRLQRAGGEAGLPHLRGSLSLGLVSRRLSRAR